MKIFLAHAKEDKKIVTELYYRLKESGYNPWLDKEDLLPGQLWRAEIPKAIKDSQVFIACLSTRSVEKQGYVQDEFKIALKTCASKPPGSIYLIPVRLDDCGIPELRQEEYGTNLRDIQWLDFFDPEGYEKLIRSLEHAKSLIPTENESNAPINDSFIPSRTATRPSSKPIETVTEQQSAWSAESQIGVIDTVNPVSAGRGSILNQISDSRVIKLAALFLLGLIVVVALSFIFRSPKLFNFGESIAGGTQGESPKKYSQDPEIQKRFSSGERLLTSDLICQDPERECGGSLRVAKDGSAAFASATDSRGYSQAVGLFNDAISEYANNPELYIYRNNAIVRQAMVEGSNKKKITLAAAVPAGSDTIDEAEQMLRGIADAQSCYIGQPQEELQNNPSLNCNPDFEDVLLEVVVVDDRNRSEIAKENARAIVVENEAISGVIGHYASSVTKAALGVYENIGTAIPVISTTSSETELNESSIFYRTTTSNKKVAEKIASYLENQDIEAVFGFYDGRDDYSRSLWRDFQDAFTGNVAGRTVISPDNVSSIIGEFNEEISSKLDEESNSVQRFAVVIVPPSTFDNGTIRSEGQKWAIVEQVSGIVKARIEKEQSGFLIGGDDLYDREALKIITGLHGMHFTIPWFSRSYANDSGSYAKIAGGKWGGRVGWATATSYDATHVFMQAFASISSDSGEIRSELTNRIPQVRLQSNYSSGNVVEFEDKETTREPFILKALDEVSSEDSSQYKLTIVDDF
ncbi:MAG: TIR domain-containing protein [Phormidesmis sp.]